MENNLKRQFFSARNIELNNRLHRMKDRINDNLKQVPDNSMQARLQGNGEADNFTGKRSYASRNYPDR